MRRRDFLRTALAAGTVSVLLPSCVSRRSPRNSTLQLGVIGTGRMGLQDMREAMWRGANPEFSARVVAVCDADSTRMAHARGEVRAFHEQRGESNVEVRTYRDFRRLLGSREVDAVLIVAPDHWHGLIAIEAAKAGKHIYLEKPLTYTIAEGQALVDAVRRNGVVLQTGSQQRSSRRFRQACEIVRNEWLGPLQSIEVTVPADHGTASADPMPVPVNLDYDRWLGPAPPAPYTEARVHPQEGFSRPGWLQVQRYCRGMISGWGSHMYDIAQWGMGMDHSGPVEVRCEGQFPERGLWNVHVGFRGEALYANGVRVLSATGEPGVRFLTQEGWVYVSRERFDCSDPDLMLRTPGPGEVALPQSRNHMENFLAAVRAGRDPICPVEIGHRSNTVCTLHHLSMKEGGRTIHWDPAKEAAAGSTGVNVLMDVSMRAPWTL